MRNMILETEICKAIKACHTVQFRYKDGLNSRQFNPYIVYKEPHTRKILVAGLEVADTAKPLVPPSWHKFEVELINAISFQTLKDVHEPDPLFTSFKSTEYGLNILCAIDRKGEFT